jgi:hypothetical protein
LRFTSNDAGLHQFPNDAGRPVLAADTDIKFWHYGYMDREDRIKKYRYYQSVDPNNELEDGYRHIVQGDIPEVPADAVLKVAGPLKLQRIDRKAKPTVEEFRECLKWRSPYSQQTKPNGGGIVQRFREMVGL